MRLYFLKNHCKSHRLKIYGFCISHFSGMRSIQMIFLHCVLHHSVEDHCCKCVVEQGANTLKGQVITYTPVKISKSAGQQQIAVCRKTGWGYKQSGLVRIGIHSVKYQCGSKMRLK